MNQFWLDAPPPTFPPLQQADGFLLLRSSTVINYEHFTFDNKDILKNRPFLLPQYETTLSATTTWLTAITHFSETQ